MPRYGVRALKVAIVKPRTILFLLSFCSVLMLTSVGCGGDDDPGTDGEGADTTAEHSTRDADGAQSGDTADAETDLGEEVDDDPENRYKLALTPKVGDRYGYQLVRTQRQDAERFKTMQKQTFDFHLSVMSVNDDGSVVVGLNFDRVRAVITAPGAKPDSTGKQPIRDSTGEVKLFQQTVQFDTKGESSIPGGERYRALVGRQILVTISGDGQIQDVSNIEPILNAVLKATKIPADSVDPRQLEAARQGLRLEVASMVGMLFFRLTPDSAVAVGDEWSQSDELPVAGDAASETTYKYTLKALREVEGERAAQIRAELRTKTKLPKKDLENDIISMKIKSVEISGDGESLVSLESGFPLSKTSEIRQAFSGLGTAKVGPEKGKSENVSYNESTRTSVKRTSFKSGSE